MLKYRTGPLVFRRTSLPSSCRMLMVPERPAELISTPAVISPLVRLSFRGSLSLRAKVASMMVAAASASTLAADPALPEARVAHGEGRATKKGPAARRAGRSAPPRDARAGAHGRAGRARSALALPGALRRARRRPGHGRQAPARRAPPLAPARPRRRASRIAHRARERLPEPQAQRDAAQEGAPRRLAQPALARPRLRLPHRPARARSWPIDPRVVEGEIRALGWDGGVGVYPTHDDWFVHADVGRNRRWEN